MLDIKLCTYNVMMSVPKPIRFNGQKERSKRLSEIILYLEEIHGKFDVLVFTEHIVNTDIVRNMLKENGWHFTSGYYRGLAPIHGGILLYSRYPIVDIKYRPFYTNCSSYDCLIGKGILYCKIVKNEKVINVFATHFQSGNSTVFDNIRDTQMNISVDFIKKINIHSSEPLVITGDFNIDMLSKPNKFKKLCSTLNCKLVPISNSSEPFTVDPNKNELVGNDDDMYYISDEYPNGCYKNYIETLKCECCPSEYLDYTLYSKNHLQPVYCEQTSFNAKMSPFSINFNFKTIENTTHLSDHHPIITTFLFKNNSKYKKKKTNDITYLKFILIFICIVICSWNIFIYNK